MVVDFSGYEGTTFMVKNNAEFPYTGENSGPDIHSIDEMLQIRVTETVTDPDETIPPQQFLN